jgi:hypothetical protein
VCGLTGFRLLRVSQMVCCFGWIYDRADLFGWRRRHGAPGGANASESR